MCFFNGVRLEETWQPVLSNWCLKANVSCSFPSFLQLGFSKTFDQGISEHFQVQANETTLCCAQLTCEPTAFCSCCKSLLSFKGHSLSIHCLHWKLQHVIHCNLNRLHSCSFLSVSGSWPRPEKTIVVVQQETSLMFHCSALRPGLPRNVRLPTLAEKTCSTHRWVFTCLTFRINNRAWYMMMYSISIDIHNYKVWFL